MCMVRKEDGTFDEEKFLRILTQGFTEEELKQIEETRKELIEEWLKENRKYFKSDEEAIAYYEYCENQD